MIKVRTRYNKSSFKKLAAAAEETLNITGNVIVDVDFCSCEEIRALNNDTRGIDRETDVLSYPFLTNFSMPFDKEHYPDDYDEKNKAVALGCVAICREFIKKAAKEDSTVYINDVYRAFTHSLLHLFGYDHATDEQYIQMHNKEDEIMKKAGIIK